MFFIKFFLPHYLDNIQHFLEIRIVRGSSGIGINCCYFSNENMIYFIKYSTRIIILKMSLPEKPFKSF